MVSGVAFLAFPVSCWRLPCWWSFPRSSHARRNSGSGSPLLHEFCKCSKRKIEHLAEKYADSESLKIIVPDRNLQMTRWLRWPCSVLQCSSQIWVCLKMLGTPKPNVKFPKPGRDSNYLKTIKSTLGLRKTCAAKIHLQQKCDFCFHRCSPKMHFPKKNAQCAGKKIHSQ